MHHRLLPPPVWFFVFFLLVGVSVLLKVNLFGFLVFLVKLWVIVRLFFDGQSRLCLVFRCLIFIRVFPTCQDGVFDLV